MRRFDWAAGVRWPERSCIRRAALALLTAIVVAVMSGVADPASANRKYSAIVVDGRNGEVLFSRKADYRRYPASLTKVMTLYMVFEELQAGTLKLTDKIPMSRRCSGMPPSKLGMKAGEKIPVEKAIVVLIVRSANDVACAVGEKLGETEYKFALKMTKKAHAIGMKRTKFRNASGLYNRGQVTTARDMATLALRIQKDFPQYYRFFKSLKVSWKGRTWSTHNRLMKYFQGADGLKTGYIRASGFNLITSARRGNMHLVGVVMGGRRSRSRDRHMVNILERNFARLLKRGDYTYPIADRLPEVRPKPDFAAIESREWLEKKVGVIPRPSPFRPEGTGEVAIAELDEDQRAPVSGGGGGGTEDAGAEDAGAEATGAEAATSAETKSAEKTVEPARQAASEPAAVRDDDKAKADDGRGKERRLPVLAASGSGARPAGAGTPAATESAGTPAQPDSSSAGTTMAATAGPDSSTGNARAQPVEEGDGQVATDELVGLAAPDGEDGRSGTTVRLASAAPGATQIAAALAPRRQWGVQLGTFTTLELAEMHLDNAQRLHPDVLTRESSALLPGQDSSGDLYRARFGPMEEALARAACERVRAGGMQCFAIEADDWGKAVRR